MDIFVPPLKPAHQTLMLAFHGFPRPNFLADKTCRWARFPRCGSHRPKWVIEYWDKYKDRWCWTSTLPRLGICPGQLKGYATSKPKFFWSELIAKARKQMRFPPIKLICSQIEARLTWCSSMSPGNKSAKEPCRQKSTREEHKKLFAGQLLLRWQNKLTTLPTCLWMTFLQWKVSIYLCFSGLLMSNKTSQDKTERPLGIIVFYLDNQLIEQHHLDDRFLAV